MISLLMLS